MNAFVSSLLAKMTFEEKLGQLNLPGAGDITTGQAQSSDIAKKIAAGKVGGLFNIKSVAKIREVQKIAVEQSRLKIPLIFGMDVIHGYETEFPIPLGLSCTWDMAEIQQERPDRGNRSQRRRHLLGLLARWWISAVIPAGAGLPKAAEKTPISARRSPGAMVKGYQEDLKGNSDILACVKHFALYGAAEAGRDYNTTDMSYYRMFNEYLPPYKAAVDAGVGSVMASFQ